MSRILVYSHDTYGFGNITRMLAIAAHMAATLEDASVLVVSSSPMLKGARIAPRVDHIKLPSVTGTARGGDLTRPLRLRGGRSVRSPGKSHTRRGGRLPPRADSG